MLSANGELISMIRACALVLLCLGLCQVAWAEEQEYFGVCDASAAALIDDTHFIVGNDEDETLALYASDGSTATAIQSFNFASYLRSNIDQECDIEDAARLGNRIYWITSHGRSKKGKLRINRYRLFATDIAQASAELQLNWGGRYDRLVEDMLDAGSWEAPDASATRETMALIARTTKLEEEKVPELEPKDAGLNVEALAIGPGQQGLLIGFRNPLREGKALMLHLQNPDALLAGSGERARFSNPIYVDLDGLGMRSMDYDPIRDIYFILAGPPGKGGPFKLFRWYGTAEHAPELVMELQFGDGSYPEALLVEGHEIHVLNDEGKRRIDKRKCKKVRVEDKSFRERRYGLEAQ